MLTFLGIFIVFASVVGGYVMEKGPLGVLFQPAELLIIFGAAVGSLFIASTRNTLMLLGANLKHIFLIPHIGKREYLELLALMGHLLSKARREGLASVESDIERPGSSPLFSIFRTINLDHELVTFICDTFRIYLVTGDPLEIETLMSIDIESKYAQAMQPVRNLAKLAESLPGLGIVAAVMGVVLTMGKISQSPEVLGHSIGAALVGTFLGVLACYGFVGPMATKLENRARERENLFAVVRAALSGAVRGASPMIAVEYGRRTIPDAYRPSFTDLENLLRRRSE